MLSDVLARVDRAHMHKKAADDMDERVGVLVAALKDGKLHGLARERTSDVIVAMSEARYADARELIKVLVAHHIFDAEYWIVGVKRALHELAPAPTVPAAGMMHPPPLAVAPPPLLQPGLAQPGLFVPQAPADYVPEAYGVAVDSEGYTNYDTWVAPITPLCAQHEM